MRKIREKANRADDVDMLSIKSNRNLKDKYNTGSTNALNSDESKNLLNYNAGFSSTKNQNDITINPKEMKIHD